MEDGSVEQLPPDPDLERRADYLADNLLPPQD